MGERVSYFVEKREGKKKTSYRVSIKVEQGGRTLHREAKTFPNYRDANAWGAGRDKELKKSLADPEAFVELVKPVSRVTLGQVIQRYQEEYSRSYGRTIGKDLDLLARSDLALIPVVNLKSSDIVNHVKRRVDGVKNSEHAHRQTGNEWAVASVSPSTAANDLVRLQTVLDAAWASWDIPVPRDEIEKARLECRRRRLVAKSRERKVTATDEQLDQLVRYFQSTTRAMIPMADIIMFAVYSCRRQDEITQLRWEDNDSEKLTGVVPRLKDPSGARTNVTFRYTQEGWDLVQRQVQVKGEARIFPYNSKSISASFTRACKVLGIKDLRFHDLRHTAVTRLFRLGYQVHEVPAFSLHRSWTTLKRYTNITPDQIKLR